jgi:hypothetical protein
VTTPHGEYGKEADKSSFYRCACSSFADLQSLTHLLIDGGSSGLPALYILKEMLSRLAFDLKLNQEMMPWRHFEMMIGTGHGG